MITQTSAQPPTPAAMLTPCIRPSCVPCSPGRASAIATDERTGMIRCEPMLHNTMNRSIASQFVPHAARPNIPTPIRAADADAMYVSGRKASIPANSAVRNPGNSRGNSRKPRASAPNAKLS